MVRSDTFLLSARPMSFVIALAENAPSPLFCGNSSSGLLSRPAPFNRYGSSCLQGCICGSDSCLSAATTEHATGIHVSSAMAAGGSRGYSCHFFHISFLVPLGIPDRTLEEYYYWNEECGVCQGPTVW